MPALRFVLVAMTFVLILTAGCGSPAPPTPTESLLPVPTETPAPPPIPTSESKTQPWLPALPDEPCVPSETRTCQVLFVLPAKYDAESGRRFPDQFRDAGYAVVVASNAPQVVEVCENTVRAAQPEKNIPVDLHLAEVQVADYSNYGIVGCLKYLAHVHSLQCSCRSHSGARSRRGSPDAAATGAPEYPSTPKTHAYQRCHSTVP
jgi:hypothetical protein